MPCVIGPLGSRSRHPLLKEVAALLNVTYVFAIVLLLLSLPLDPALSKESKELRKQRQAAQKERQQQKKNRTAELRQATRAFRDFTRNLKTDYKAKLKELDVAFELEQVALRADRDAKIAAAEAEYQQKLMGLLTRPDKPYNEAAIEALQTQGKGYADELFNVKKEFDMQLHRAQMALEQQKADLLAERDRTALDKAAKLGLTKDYTPILATPIGDDLTKREIAWNERERKEVDKIAAKNRKLLSEFVNGAALRAWEMKNLETDFHLACDEKRELHELDAQQLFYNTIFVQAAQGGQVDQQDLMAKISEISKQNKLIKIKYKKIWDQNRIMRREERKKILEQQ